MLKFYHLAEHPFSIIPNTRFFYTSLQHRAIIQKIDYVIRYRQGLTVVYGDVGYGKTILARTLNDQYQDQEVRYIKTPRWKSEFAMMKAICAEFDIEPKKSLQEQMNLFLNKLLDIHATGKNAILILDEAQFLKGQQFEALREINNFETSDAKLMQMVLLGQMELKNKLRLKRALMSRVILTSSLSSFTLEDMGEMVKFRIQQAGGTDPDIFTPEAMKRIYELSKGLPRDCVKLCGLTLEMGFMNKIKPITADLVEASYGELRQ